MRYVRPSNAFLTPFIELLTRTTHEFIDRLQASIEHGKLYLLRTNLGVSVVLRSRLNRQSTSCDDILPSRTRETSLILHQ
ncbi:hypothetical protein ABKN59_007224 [Abortiporus biennis]